MSPTSTKALSTLLTTSTVAVSTLISTGLLTKVLRTDGCVGSIWKRAPTLEIFVVGFGTGIEVTVTSKATVTEPPTGIFGSGIPTFGLPALGRPLIVTLPGTKAKPLGTISLNTTLVAGRVPVLVITEVKVIVSPTSANCRSALFTISRVAMTTCVGAGLLSVVLGVGL